MQYITLSDLLGLLTVLIMVATLVLALFNGKDKN